MIYIKNCSDTYMDYKYVIYRVVDGINWYYGASNDINRCSDIVNALGDDAKITESENVRPIHY